MKAKNILIPANLAKWPLEIPAVVRGGLSTTNVRCGGDWRARHQEEIFRYHGDYLFGES